MSKPVESGFARRTPTGTHFKKLSKLWHAQRFDSAPISLGGAVEKPSGKTVVGVKDTGAGYAGL